MSARRPAQKHDPFKRYRTRTPGVTYRLRSDGSRSYQVYDTAVGRHVSVSGGEAEARRLQAELRARKSKLAWPQSKPNARFAELAEEWFEIKKKTTRRSTWEGYRRSLDLYLLPAYGHALVGAISPDMIAGHIAELGARGFTGSYVANIMKPLNQTLGLALRNGVIALNAYSALLPQERPKIKRSRRHLWTPEDIRALLNAARDLGSRPGNIYDYTPLLTVAVFSGLRPSELLALRWQDVDLDRLHLRIRNQLSRQGTLEEPKTEAGLRDVPIPLELASYLRKVRLKSPYSLDEHFVFSSSKGTPLDHQNVGKRGFQAAVAKAGLNHTSEPKLTQYDLRRAFASVVAHFGIAATDFAAYMGHGDARVTEEVYIKPYNTPATADRVRAAVGKAMIEALPD